MINGSKHILTPKNMKNDLNLKDPNIFENNQNPNMTIDESKEE
jgi:hypothetical protein